LLVGKTFPKGGRIPEKRRTGSGLEEHGGCSGSEGTPSTIYCRKSCFLPLGGETAKKVLYGVCHFELLGFLKVKWQKKAKPTVNSRGILFFKEFTFIKLY
jgi:hypothetical protein